MYIIDAGIHECHQYETRRNILLNDNFSVSSSFAKYHTSRMSSSINVYHFSRVSYFPEDNIYLIVYHSSRVLYFPEDNFFSYCISYFPSVIVTSCMSYCLPIILLKNYPYLLFIILLEYHDYMLYLILMCICCIYLLNLLCI